MATLPFFVVHIQQVRSLLGPHEKKIRGYPGKPKTLGEHLRKCRLDLYQTQEQVARVFEITVTAYISWEGDDNIPSVRKWPTVVRFLGYDPTPTPTSFAESVAALRRLLGFDKKRLATRLGVDVKSVLNWEAGRTKPFSGVRQKLAKLAPNLPLLASG